MVLKVELPRRGGKKGSKRKPFCIISLCWNFDVTENGPFFPFFPRQLKKCKKRSDVCVGAITVATVLKDQRVFLFLFFFLHVDGRIKFLMARLKKNF